jgi:hypothetical protein
VLPPTLSPRLDLVLVSHNKPLPNASASPTKSRPSKDDASIPQPNRHTHPRTRLSNVQSQCHSTGTSTGQPYPQRNTTQLNGNALESAGRRSSGPRLLQSPHHTDRHFGSPPGFGWNTNHSSSPERTRHSSFTRTPNGSARSSRHSSHQSTSRCATYPSQNSTTPSRTCEVDLPASTSRSTCTEQTTHPQHITIQFNGKVSPFAAPIFGW